MDSWVSLVLASALQDSKPFLLFFCQEEPSINLNPDSYLLKLFEFLFTRNKKNVWSVFHIVRLNRMWKNVDFFSPSFVLQILFPVWFVWVTEPSDSERRKRQGFYFQRNPLFDNTLPLRLLNFPLIFQISDVQIRLDEGMWTGLWSG